MRSAWRDVFGEDFPARGIRPHEVFEHGLALVRARRESDPASMLRFDEILDVQAQEDLAGMLLDHADVDSLTPMLVKKVMLAECRRLGAARIELPRFLQSALARLFADAEARIPSIGPNRHWPRLRQYLRELEAATDNSPSGRGVHIINSIGAGRAGREPKDPCQLVIRIDPRHL